jgi:hypothetical protein
MLAERSYCLRLPPAPTPPAARSRACTGGIHFRSDNEVGLELGRRVGSAAVRVYDVGQPVKRGREAALRALQIRIVVARTTGGLPVPRWKVTRTRSR